MSLPRYPVYVPSKARADRKLSLTVSLLEADSIPYYLVIESQDFDRYAEVYGEKPLLLLPLEDQGLSFARNFCKKHSVEIGARRHWQLDDNIKSFRRLQGKLHRCPATLALTSAEDFIDRYENVAIAGLRSTAFGWTAKEPFVVNRQVYSCVLVDNSLRYEWRGALACEDTDYSLQVLTGGYCTVLFNAFQIEKAQSGKMKGGCTDFNDYLGDGRIKRARWLQRQWPSLDIKVTRMWGRPAQNLNHIWRRFDTQLKRNAG